ncbi:MAG: YegP family protein [Reyranella sp.]|uniref:YegP family protein n=1 Tax=Reyranella sp. TaxID=1929291 RepID=UPI003D0D0733
MSKTTTKPRRPKSRYRYVFEVYRAKDGWRWRLWARNGRIVAVSGEAYKRAAAAVKQCENLQDYAAQSTVFLKGKEML